MSPLVTIMLRPPLTRNNNEINVERTRSWGSAVWLRTGRSGFDSRQGQEMSVLAPRPDRALRPTQRPVRLALLFPWGFCSRGVNLTTHLHLVWRSRNSGTAPPLAGMSSWRGVWLAPGTTLPLQKKKEGAWLRKEPSQRFLISLVPHWGSWWWRQQAALNHRSAFAKTHGATS